MIKYKLEQDEVLLSRATAYVNDNDYHLFRVLVTNKYLALMPYYCETSDDENNNIVRIDVAEIKIYNGQPQVKKYENKLEIYLTNDVLYLSFTEKKEEKDFISSINTVLTGKTTAEMNMEKVGKKIGFFDKTFGTNTVETVKNVLTTGLSGAISVFNPKRKAAKAGLKATQNILMTIGKTQTKRNSDEQALLESKEKSFDSMCDQLIKLNELLTQGIITQEEFETQKALIISTTN